MIRHIWFDVGGTLYEETSTFDAVHDALRYSTYADIVGEHDAERAKGSYGELYAQYGSNSAVFSSLGKPSDFWQNTFDSMNLADILTPNPTVSKTLEQLSNIMPVSLFTNFKPAKIENVLQLVGVRSDIFTNVISGDDVKKRKPDSEGFEKMVEVSGIPPNQLLYVGDRVDVDIKPAKAVGMLTCLIYQTSPEADYSILEFSELLSVVHK
jgi:HAD superfamily hydrolase (TIGR01549 family)